MGEDKEELSDEEYEALLRDLEGRASGAETASGGEEEEDVEVEDIDAF